MQRGVLLGGAQAPVRPPPTWLCKSAIVICHDRYHSINILIIKLIKEINL